MNNQIITKIGSVLVPLLLALAMPSNAHQAGPVTEYDVDAGSFVCFVGGNTGPHSGTTPTGGSFRVGAPNHLHATLRVDAFTQGNLGCWVKIELGEVVWTPGAKGTVQAKIDGVCGPISSTTTSSCTVEAFFGFTRPVHNVGVTLPYCILVSLDGINFDHPSGGPVCNNFRFFDPPLVDAGGSLDPSDPLGGFDATVAGHTLL